MSSANGSRELVIKILISPQSPRSRVHGAGGDPPAATLSREEADGKDLDTRHRYEGHRCRDGPARAGAGAKAIGAEGEASQDLAAPVAAAPGRSGPARGPDPQGAVEVQSRKRTEWPGPRRGRHGARGSGGARGASEPGRRACLRARAEWLASPHDARAEVAPGIWRSRRGRCLTMGAHFHEAGDTPRSP